MNKFHDIFLELEQQIVQGDYQPAIYYLVKIN